jgi:hypothetical protein
MSKINRIPGSALERGQFIRTCSDPHSLAHHAENRELVALMYKQFRFEWVMELALNKETGKWEPSKPTDEWVIIGRNGQAYEQGVRKLGVTVATGVMLGRALRTKWLNPHQIGDGEGNFWCDWTEENIQLVADFVSLRRRRAKSKATAETAKRGLEALKRYHGARKALGPHPAAKTPPLIA